MEQISIIERFPYPFQVSPHCTPFAGLLCLAGGCWGEDPRGTWGQTRHRCPSASCHSAVWGCPAAVHTAWGRQVSFCEPQGIGQLYLRGLLRWKPASELCPALFSPLADAGGMLAAGCLLGPQPSFLPLLAPSMAPDTPKVREGSGKSRGRGLIYNLSVTVP